MQFVDLPEEAGLKKEGRRTPDHSTQRGPPPHLPSLACSFPAFMNDHPGRCATGVNYRVVIGCSVNRLNVNDGPISIPFHFIPCLIRRAGSTVDVCNVMDSTPFAFHVAGSTELRGYSVHLPRQASQDLLRTVRVQSILYSISSTFRVHCECRVRSRW